KCGRDAREFFEREWPADRDTLMRHQRNHYNKSLKKCFVLVEVHYKQQYGNSSSWFNSMHLFDVYENLEYGKLREYHEIMPGCTDMRRMYGCIVASQKRTSVDEFSTKVNPYMDN